jgi:MerR family transcriptional regulator, light-induced transcriptional regulator
MNVFSIKDLEALSGIKAHTIRIWEQRYAVLKPDRTDTNIRTYNNEELRYLLNVALLNKHGYKISSITRMSDAEVSEKILGLNHESAQSEHYINQLIMHMSNLDMVAFENIIDRQVKTIGLKKSITGLVFPFLGRIGMLWQTNHINPAQEHLVSHLLRQKIIAAIDRTATPVLGRSVLLFLPPGEYHEISLLFVQYLLKSEGIPTLYLGANVPLNDLPEVIRIKKPVCVFTHITSLSPKNPFDKFMNQLLDVVQGVPLAISGKQAQQYKGIVPKGIMLKKSLEEVSHFITREI